ncbi:hypothetical protein Droror1_Dr00015561 [Drosera rotundifolia]
MQRGSISLSPTVTFLPQFSPQTLTHLHLTPSPKPFTTLPKTLTIKPPKTHCSASRSKSGDGDGEKRLKKWVGERAGGISDTVLRTIAGSTSSPIFQFIDAPVTFLHSVDPRVKLVWLLAFVLIPARSNISIRFAVVLYLALLSVWTLPKNVWKDQLGRAALLSGVIFIMLAFSADGVAPIVSPRTPPPEISGLPNLPCSFQGYSYIIVKIWPLQLTRKGLSVASIAACLTFTVLQSASLCLATTPPEELASALRWFMLPLKHVGVPVAEIILTLLLSLRFINLVYDEVRNVALGILSRRVSWEQLTIAESIEVFIMYIRRIAKNIFSHAEQIAQAMVLRGFRGDSETHKLYFSRDSGLRMADIVSLLALVGLTGVALMSDRLLI